MKNQKRTKQIMAWIILFMLAALYLVTFFLAMTGSPATKDLFMACFICTIVFPVLLYILNWLTQLIFGKPDEDAAENGTSKNK